MFNEYPYRNLTDVNLDYILKHIKDLATNLQDFIKLNTIKYADPIDWNISKQYESNTVVVNDFTGVAYLSTKPVPSGVDVTNTDYWTPIFTLDFVNMNKNITLRNDGNNNNATFASTTGDWLIVGGQLYKVIQNIALHTAYVVGYNIQIYSVELFVRDYLNQVLNLIGDLQELDTEDKSSVVNAINSVLSDINTMIGDLDELNTEDKTSVVKAINEVLSNLSDLSDTVTNINNKIGNLQELDTEDKSSVVNAINEVLNGSSVYATPEQYGAVGDGETDDTQAFVNALADCDILILSKKTYLVNTLTITKRSFCMFGTGVDSKIRSAGITITGCNDVHFYNFTFDDSETVDTLVKVEDSYHTTFDHVNVSSNHGSNNGIVFDGTVKMFYAIYSGGRINHFNVGCTFQNTSNACTLFNNLLYDNATCVKIDSCNGIRIQNNTFQNFSVTGVKMQWTSGGNVIANVVMGNYFEGTIDTTNMIGDIDLSNDEHVGDNFIIGNKITYRGKPHVANEGDLNTILDYTRATRSIYNEIPNFTKYEVLPESAVSSYRGANYVGQPMPFDAGHTNFPMMYRVMLKDRTNTYQWATMILADPVDDRDVSYYCSVTDDKMYLQTLRSGDTAHRPGFKCPGYEYFDTTLGKPIFQKTSGVWVDATGATV